MEPFWAHAVITFAMVGVGVTAKLCVPSSLHISVLAMSVPNRGLSRYAGMVSLTCLTLVLAGWPRIVP